MPESSWGKHAPGFRKGYARFPLEWFMGTFSRGNRDSVFPSCDTLSELHQQDTRRPSQVSKCVILLFHYSNDLRIPLSAERCSWLRVANYTKDVFSHILMASRTRWTWVWVNSGRWWWTGRPGVLRCMGSQRVGHDWATELNWTELMTVEDGLAFRE